MAGGLQQQQIRGFITQGALDDLRQRVAYVPLYLKLLADFRAVMKELTPEQRYDLWHQAGRRNDRLAGILAVAELRMPPRDVFQAPMRPGHITDNDTARTFILKTRTEEGISGRLSGMFYPEVAHLSPAERVLTIAAAHIGCQPSSPRQINLFSLSCALNEHVANQAAHKRTTCALFMRSVLIAAGDRRFEGDMLKLQDSTDMLGAMGLQHQGPIVNKDQSPEWISAIDSPLPPSTVPKPGDLYYVMIPSGFGKRKPFKGDSGHVGIVVQASRAGTVIKMETIDGGQGTDGLGTTRSLARMFIQNALGEWDMTSHAQVAGEFRILLGLVDLASVAHQFQSNAGLLMDGRAIPTTL